MNESQKRKQTPVYSGVMMYFPAALDAVSRQSWAGNEKHNPGEPLHWAREKSSDHMDCAARHMMTPDTIDPETGETHLTAAAWRILAALQIQQEKRAQACDIENEEGEVIEKSVPLVSAFDLTEDQEKPLLCAMRNSPCKKGCKAGECALHLEEPTHYIDVWGNRRPID